MAAMHAELRCTVPEAVQPFGVAAEGSQSGTRDSSARLLVRRAGANPCQDCLSRSASSLAAITWRAKRDTASQLAGLSSIRGTRCSWSNGLITWTRRCRRPPPQRNRRLVIFRRCSYSLLGFWARPEVSHYDGKSLFQLLVGSSSVNLMRPFTTSIVNSKLEACFFVGLFDERPEPASSFISWLVPIFDARGEEERWGLCWSRARPSLPLVRSVTGSPLGRLVTSFLLFYFLFYPCCSHESEPRFTR